MVKDKWEVKEMNYIEDSILNYPDITFLKKYIKGTNGFIAGGCFKNIFNKEKVKDVDMFFETQDDFSAARTKYITDKDFELEYETKNVSGFKEKKTGIVVELVRSFTSSPYNMLDQFDFTVAKACVRKDSNEEYKFVYHPKFFEHLFFKRLVFDGKLYRPISVYNRMMRYIGYGYRPCKETKLKLLNAIVQYVKDNNILEFAESDIEKTLYDGLD